MLLPLDLMFERWWHKGVLTTAKRTGLTRSNLLNVGPKLDGQRLLTLFLNRKFQAGMGS